MGSPPLLTLIQIALLWSSNVDAEAEQIGSADYGTLVEPKEFAFLNFYADWCRFSQMLKPMWDEMANQIKTTYSDRVLIGKVDCDRESALAQKFNVNKYPTMKLVRNGRIIRKEYRGQRSVEALVSFVNEQMKEPLEKLESMKDLLAKKRSVVGYFESEESENYRLFKQISSELRDHCTFFVGSGETFIDQRLAGQDTIVFKDTGSDDVVYTSELGNADLLREWALSNCIPLVREITFENGEELTEEGLPFLILFHDPNDIASLKLFKETVARELSREKNTVNFITADGYKFSHPLGHLGKTSKDLPLLAIDSFRHMYIFPNFEDIKQPGRLIQFVEDLKSGKLHREFHHGPDPVQEQPKEVEAKPDDTPAPSNDAAEGEPVQRKPQPIEADHAGSGSGAARAKRSDGSPPESAFNKILPSSNRYTLLGRRHDEL
ncbi:endoplasmic reticulum resident protein 44-like isoform X2 [Oscarella lobularis]|uniref:endoplasmic reticulum resident protein 44-like isoform X2 n=1 Tax=Oscarella lobularis TaxID=121494 RepID=UPI0033132FC0